MSTAVTFKHETHIGDVPAGPVTVIDTVARAADPNVRRGAIRYGYEPSWREDRGWLTLDEARAVAAEHGVELEEH